MLEIKEAKDIVDRGIVHEKTKDKGKDVKEKEVKDGESDDFKQPIKPLKRDNRKDFPVFEIEDY